jgi:hypothetical protein
MFQRFSIKFDDNLSVTHVFILFLNLQGRKASNPLPPTGLCRGWGRSGSFNPLAAALVMAVKQ